MYLCNFFVAWKNWINLNHFPNHFFQCFKFWPKKHGLRVFLLFWQIIWNGNFSHLPNYFWYNNEFCHLQEFEFEILKSQFLPQKLKRWHICIFFPITEIMYFFAIDIFEKKIHLKWEKCFARIKEHFLLWSYVKNYGAGQS